jgi:hypothetical protein
MLKRPSTVLAFAAVVAAGTLSAQDFAPGNSATLGALRFSVPSPYAAVPEMSDSGAAVYGHAASQTWVFVAPLRRMEDRPAVIRDVLRRFGTTVLGGNPDTLDWQITPDFLSHAGDVFHQRVESLGGATTLDVSFRQVRSGGADVLVGAVFALKAGEPERRCGEWGNVIAIDAAAWVVASLLGRDPPARTPFDTSPVMQTAWSNTNYPTPSPPTDPEAADLVSLYNDYATLIRANRRSDIAVAMAPAVLEFAADLKQLVLHGTPEEIRALPALSRMRVLMLRHQFDATRLARFSPREIFSVSGEGTPPDLTAGTPRLMGNVAFMDLQLNGRPSPYFVVFVRYGEVWRIDSLPLAALQGCVLRLRLRRDGVTRAQEDAALLQNIERVSGRRPSDDIWLPMVRGQGGRN